MELRISGHIVKLDNDINVSLKYDSVADTFSFLAYFDPNNPTHKEIFQPGTYQTCEVWHHNVLLTTGTILNHKFSSAGDPPKQLAGVSGYTKTGILNECTTGLFADGTFDVDKSSQFDGKTLEQIANDVCSIFPITVMIDDELQTDAQFTTPYDHISINQQESIGRFLDRLCKAKNTVLSHDRFGNLLITRAVTKNITTTTRTLVDVNAVAFTEDIDGAPSSTATVTTTTETARQILYNFSPSNKGVWLNMDLSFDGQSLHSVIQVVAQQNAANATDSGITNPFVLAYSSIIPMSVNSPDKNSTTHDFRSGLRLRREVAQEANSENDAPDTARSILGDELKAIVLTIEIQGWTLGGNLVIPNQLITVTNNELFLYNQTTWFIQEVHFKGAQNVNETATIVCVLPECFNDDEITTSIFNG